MSHSSPRMLASAFLGLLILLFPFGKAPAYDIETHKRITAEALLRSGMQESIGKSLGLDVDSKVKDKSVGQWIQYGAELEDDLIPTLPRDHTIGRPMNHFHNPLWLDWTQAGYRPLSVWEGSPLGRSSILWSQDPANTWSWSKVRSYYRDALTQQSVTVRTDRLADTLRGLGHLVHLIQDASVPQHTRNDPHGGISIETILDLILAAEPEVFDTYLGPVVRPDTSWRTMPPNPLAPAAIARLFDTDRYTGQNPQVTIEDSIGLAEYSNANFVTEDRNWASPAKNALSYPSRSGVEEQNFDVQLPSGEFVRRRYYVKIRDGDAGYRVATVGYLMNYIVWYGLSPSRYGEHTALDEMVYRDIAPRVLPRAVGYSAELLDYFFRGQLRTSVQTTRGPAGLQATLRISNDTPGEAMQGTFTLYYDTPDGRRWPVASWNLMLAPGQTSSPLAALIPSGAAPTPWTLVFRGTLGQEPDAVAATRIGVTQALSLGYRFLDAGTQDEPQAYFGEWTPTDDVTPYWLQASSLYANETVVRMRSDVLAGGTLSFTHQHERDNRFLVVYQERTSGGRSTLVLSPTSMLCHGFDEIWYYHFAYRHLTTRTTLPTLPVTVEIEALVPPRDLDTLFRYTYLDPPQRLGSEPLLTLTTAEVGQSFEVDVTGVPFFGIRLKTSPTDPGALPPDPIPQGYPSRTYQALCGAAVAVQLIELSP